MARTNSRNKSTRSETDSFGPIDVPADRYWGAQTERSRQNFKIGQDRMPMPIVHALGIVKLITGAITGKLVAPTAVVSSSGARGTVHPDLVAK